MADLAARINNRFRQMFGFIIAPLVTLLKPYRETLLVRNLANIISASRPIPALLLAYALFAAPTYWVRLIFVALTALLMLTDGIDGALARGLGIVSYFGAACDPIVDKILFAALSISLVLHLGQLALGIAVGLLLTIELLNMVTGLYAGYLARRLGKKAGAGDWGKLKFAAECVFIFLGWLIPEIGVSLIVCWLFLIVILPLSVKSLSGYVRMVKENWALSPC